MLKTVLDFPQPKHGFLITSVEGQFHKWLLNKIRLLFPSNENYVLTNIIWMLATSKMKLFETTVCN